MHQRPERLNPHCKLGLYTLAAGAMAVGNAFAAPTLSPNAPVMFETEDSDNFLFDIDGNGIDDFQFSLFFTGEEGSCDLGNQGFVGLNGYFGYAGVLSTTGSEFNGYASMVSAGSMIGADGNFAQNSVLTACYDLGGESNEEFPVGVTGFIGLEFERSGATHYGYLEYRSENGSMIANVLEACFESEPDTGIEAGSCSEDEPEPPVPAEPAVPVPVSGVAIPLSLALLALGGAALRRRKQQA
jgi:MYXO-CTERM domain-containing protein